MQVAKPLFDRLVDLEPAVPSEPRPLRTLDRAGLLESIRRELERLFSTTSPLKPSRLVGRERTAIDYGIPDPVSFSSDNQGHHQSFVQLAEAAIRAFEPRLEDPRLLVERGKVPGALAFRLTAFLRQDEVKMPIHFPIVLREKEVVITIAPSDRE